MSTPVLHILAGPNGSGKTTFVRRVLVPTTHLPFINADEIAAERWPGRETEHAYHASRDAMQARDDAIRARRSFITETVFSHASKIDLIRQARSAGYLVSMHVILVPEEVSVRRVQLRVAAGGHDVPEQKIRERYRRLWGLVALALPLAGRVAFYDNSRVRTPFRVIAEYTNGSATSRPEWPRWAPPGLTGA